MNLLFITTILFVIYFSIVYASHAKFNNKGLRLDLKHKTLLIFLPLFIVFLHVRAANKVFKTDKKKAYRIIRVSIINYPIMLGSFIELLKENMAECDVFGSSRLVSFKKTKKKTEAKKSTTIINLKDIVSYMKNIKIYEDMLINKHAI